MAAILSLPESKRRLLLALYPDVSLKAARQARDSTRELLAQSIDPAERKKADKAEAEKVERENALTFEAVARKWFEKKTLELMPDSGNRFFHG